MILTWAPAPHTVVRFSWFESGLEKWKGGTNQSEGFERIIQVPGCDDGTGLGHHKKLVSVVVVVARLGAALSLAYIWTIGRPGHRLDDLRSPKADRIAVFCQNQQNRTSDNNSRRNINRIRPQKMILVATSTESDHRKSFSSQNQQNQTSEKDLRRNINRIRPHKIIFVATSTGLLLLL